MTASATPDLHAELRAMSAKIGHNDFVARKKLDDERRAHRLAEPGTPRKARQIGGLLQKQSDKNHGHQPQ